MKYIISLFVLMIGVTALSQPANPGGSPPAGAPPVGTGVPLDGGAIALLIAGTAYGVKTLRKKKENNKVDDSI